MSSQQLAIGY